MTSRKRIHPTSEKPLDFGTMGADRSTQTIAPTNNTGGVGGMSTLQELTGNVIRRQVEEERKYIIRKHSGVFDGKRFELELRREQIQRQLREVEEQMKSVEIDCHQDMLVELDHFDNERQPEMLDVLTDTGQLDRICPLCETYFRSSTELPDCCLGRDRCHLHTVQRCCFSCSRLSFYDIFQCLALTDDKGKRNNEEEIRGLGIVDDLDTLETAASTPSWMLDQIFGEGAGLIGREDEDEYEESAKTIAAAVVRLVPSESGSVICPVCHKQYCDHDLLYHFAACCRQAQNDNQGAVVCLEVSE